MIGSKWAMTVRGVPVYHILWHPVQPVRQQSGLLSITGKSTDFPSRQMSLLHSFYPSLSSGCCPYRSFGSRSKHCGTFSSRRAFWSRSSGQFTWSTTAVGGWPEVWRRPSKPLDGWSIGYFFGIGVNAAVSGNATFAVNIMDISRHSQNVTAAWATQLLTLPVLVTLTEFLGCTMAMASSVVYGEVQWNPLTVINNFDNRAGKILCWSLLHLFQYHDERHWQYGAPG